MSATPSSRGLATGLTDPAIRGDGPMAASTGCQLSGVSIFMLEALRIRMGGTAYRRKSPQRKRLEAALRTTNNVPSNSAWRVQQGQVQLRERADQVYPLATKLTQASSPASVGGLRRFCTTTCSKVLVAARMRRCNPRFWVCDDGADRHEVRVPSMELEALLGGARCSMCSSSHGDHGRRPSDPLAIRDRLRVVADQRNSSRNASACRVALDYRRPVLSSRATEPCARCLFEAVRELLFNIVKHAGVKRADVSLTSTSDGNLQVTVRDGGRGFDLEDLASDSARGLGLSAIRDRLRLFNGRVDVTTAPRRGTQICLTVPFSTRGPRRADATEV